MCTVEMTWHIFLENRILPVFSLADPGFGQGGGPRNFVRDFADVAKQSRASKASQYWPGSRVCLSALEALAFLTVKYAFSHFHQVLFLQIFTVALCGYITKYLLKYGRFWPFLTKKLSFS